MVKSSTFNARDVGSIPGWGAKSPCAMAKKPNPKSELILERIQ